MPRWRWQSTLVLGSLVVGAIAAPVPALAQQADPEKRAAAQALFDAGRQLTAQERFSDACPKLLESYRLDPAIGTKFYLAQCYEHIGRLASAWTYYLEVVEEAHQEGAKGKDKEKFATQRAEALKPRLPRLVVKRSPAVRTLAGLAVERDGLAVGEGMWDTPVPIDLGEHTLRATAPGKKPLVLRVEAKDEGAEVVVEIPALEAVATPPPVDPVKPPPPIETPPPKPVSSAQRIAGFTLGGAGIAGLGAGIGLGVLAMSKKNASNGVGLCNSADVCTTAGHQLRVDGIQAATASTALFVVGGAALVTGVVLVATAPSKPKQDAGPSAAVSLGPLGASILGRF